MRLFALITLVVVGFTVTSCKSGDKCGDCPTFSKVEKIGEKEQI